MSTAERTLEQRVAALEEQMQRLIDLFTPPSGQETPAERGARSLRAAQANQAALSEAVAKAFEEAGITAEPVGVEKLREMMLQEGIRPEDNEFSREIIAMREE